MKPRIRKDPHALFGFCWKCGRDDESTRLRGYGRTPLEAYNDWLLQRGTGRFG